MSNQHSQHLQKTQTACVVDSTNSPIDNNLVKNINNNPSRYHSNSNIQIQSHKLSASRPTISNNNLLTNVQSNVYQMSRNSPQRATVTKKTRTYMVDGVEGIN